MLELKNISKSFGDTKALEGISLEIKEGEVWGLLGPDGAGKTTLLRILVGFYQADEGEIWWKNKPADTSLVDYRKNIGYLPENNPLYYDLTPKEYLNLIAELKGVEAKMIKNQITRVVDECGVDEYLDKKIETLSKGYRQRVGLAAALLGNPLLLVLDEPTYGLEPKQMAEIRKLIAKLGKKKMVILSTHLLAEARDVSQRIGIINRGRIVFNQATSKIRGLEKKFIELTG